MSGRLGIPKYIRTLGMRQRVVGIEIRERETETGSWEGKAGIKVKCLFCRH